MTFDFLPYICLPTSICFHSCLQSADKPVMYMFQSILTVYDTRGVWCWSSVVKCLGSVWIL